VLRDGVGYIRILIFGLRVDDYFHSSIACATIEMDLKTPSIICFELLFIPCTRN
jgi:hypothetical protein